MPNTIYRLLPPASGAFATSPMTVNGRSYNPSAGMQDVPCADADNLCATGWTLVAPVGGTAERPRKDEPSSGRPVRAERGVRYLDTDVGAMLVFDGVAWRNALTGSAT